VLFARVLCVCARARAVFVLSVCVLHGRFFFFFRFSFFSSSFIPSFFEVEEDKEDKDKEDKEEEEEEEENDDEDIIIIIEAAAVALQKVLDEIVFSCHRRVDSFDVLGCAELRATTRTKTKSDDNDEGGE
jgi:hypothetical protein